MSVWVVTCALAIVATVGSIARADDKDRTAAELVNTVKTSRSRVEMSAFLVRDAEAARTKRDWGRAIPLYEALVVARGPASPDARKLADIYALAGQPHDAVSVLTAFAATTEDPGAQKDAREAIDRLQNVSDAFSKPVPVKELDKVANQSFKLGRAAFAKKQYADALVYYTMGYRIAPDLPGFLRELAATYDKLGAPDKKLAFYLAYLHRRPVGKNADEVRKALAGEKNVLGKLTISSALTCDEVWLMGQQITAKLPRKDLTVPPGEYKALCFSGKYELSFFEYATVTAGQSALLAFNWGIVVNQLEKPYGRISIENPMGKPGEMLDLGIDQPEIGVVVPADGHAMRMVLKDDSGTTPPVERFVKIAPGQRLVVKW